MKFTASAMGLLGLVISTAEASMASRTLLPAYPPGHNASDPTHLSPKMTQALHYRENGKTEEDPSSFGHMVSNFNHPTVVLDHSVHISNVTCSTHGMNICFKSDEAKRQASEDWNTSQSPLILATYHPGCGDYMSGSRSYWNVSSITFQPGQRCARANVTELPLEQATKDFDLDFGHYKTPVENARGKARRMAGDALIASSSTMDITDDPAELSDFFGIKITEDYTEVPEAAPLQYNGTATPEKRGVLQRRWDPIGWIKEKVTQVKEAVVEGYHTYVEPVVKKVVDLGKKIGSLIQDPLGYEWSLGASVSQDWNIGGKGTQKVPTTSGLFGEGEGLVIADSGVFPGELSCENCYAKGDVSVSGHIGWSINDGLKTGYLKAGASWDSQLALAMKLQGQKKIEGYKKQLLAKNLVNLEIPGVISIGPEVSLSAVIDIYFQAQADVLIGAKFEVSPGEVHLDLVNQDNNKLSGFDTKFTPIAKFDGPEASVTLDFGLPLGLEFGIDLLNGKWKRTAGIFDQPSFQVVGKVLSSNCDGIDINLVVQNYFYLSVGALYDYAIDLRELWSKPLGCVGTSQTSTDSRQSALTSRNIAIGSRQSNTTLEDPEHAVNQTFGNGGTSSQPPTLIPVVANESLVEPVTGFSYKLVSDINQTAIMISGKEDRIYLAPYGDPDASSGAPFAVEAAASDSVLIGDVFGGYFNYNPTEMEQTGVSNLRSSRLTNVPVGSKFIALAEVPTEVLGSSLGMYVAVDEKEIYALVTCSVINMGTRVYVANSSTNVVEQLNQNKLADTVIGGDVRGCQYLYLTSGTKGLSLL
ncbi:hypothetical protein AtubIFM56815_004397 [Aspergillus tubingensis]|uniref:DUF7029 domain-containing protein n=1 Tax=Aspergillus tubingensis TaxID=5068 RepID=A0A9W6AYZ0_ASPTU|nr:hypothetical protein AtubIFM54640_007117 [Aspergillus tubingensis]GLA89904.1 hypothetical protein AtubIFM56815_004397 [Aspergillus tubingensis]